MEGTLKTGTGSLTIYIDSAGCHHPLLAALGCEEHAYLHRVGVTCLDCGAQFFYPADVWCEPGTERPGY